MKKPTTLLILLTLTLTACGASTVSRAGATSQTDPATRTLSGVSLLAIGTLKLKGTPQAVTAEQAKDLLPLWQVYQSLSTSDNAAQEEIDALVKQIEDTMTPDQMSAINNLGLTPQDMFSTMQELGIAMGAGRPSSGNSSSNSGRNFGPGGAGGPPPEMGGMPGGGAPGQGQGGSGMSQSQIATAQASRGANGGGPGGGFGNRVPSALLEAVIQYLQEVTGS